MLRILVLCLTMFPFAAIAGKSALVIGNSAYRAVDELDNPKNDAIAVADALTAQGFDVVKALDVDRNQMLEALRNFRDMADRSDFAIVYYAGHGMEIAGVNYLIPVDARLRDERDARVELIDVDTVLDQISGARRMKMVVLDACRNNPFVTLMKKENRGRGIGRGLGQIDTAGADTLIAYAAAAGAITPDGVGGRNSPFTTAFLKALRGPPRDVRRMLGTVRDEMRLSVPGAAPFVYTSLGGGEFIINPNSFQPPSEDRAGADTAALEPAPAVPAPVRSSESMAIFADFLAADQAATVGAWDAFLLRYAAISDDQLYLLALKKRNALLTTANTRSTQPADTAAPGIAQAKPVPVLMPVPATRKEAVRALQKLLKEHGCYRGYLDGIYGRGSARGVAKLAARAELPVTLPARPDKASVVSALGAFSGVGDVRCKLPPRVARDTAARHRATTPAARPATPAPAGTGANGQAGESSCLSFEGQSFCN